METKTIVLERQNASTTTYEVEVPADYDEDELVHADPTELRDTLESDPDVSLVQITETFDDEVGILEDDGTSSDEDDLDNDTE